MLPLPLPQGLAAWLLRRYPRSLRTVYLKYQAAGGGGPKGEEKALPRGRLLAGEAPVAGRPITFVENGVKFHVSTMARDEEWLQGKAGQVGPRSGASQRRGAAPLTTGQASGCWVHSRQVQQPS